MNSHLLSLLLGDLIAAAYFSLLLFIYVCMYFFFSLSTTKAKRDAHAKRKSLFSEVSKACPSNWCVWSDPQLWRSIYARGVYSSSQRHTSPQHEPKILNGSSLTTRANQSTGWLELIQPPALMTANAAEPAHWERAKRCCAMICSL